MAAKQQPETLPDLLKTLERSADLRSLARDCGLSVRELRRRLAIWRRSIAANENDGATGSKPVAPLRSDAKKRRTSAAPDAMDAADLASSPMPAKGSPIMEVFTDGASRGNPGPAAIGIVFRQKEGPALAVHSEAIGKTTNNMAEYHAVVTALEHCVRWKVEKVHLYMDSELIVRQLSGVYRVKSQDLRPLYQQVVFLSRKIPEFKVTHVKRALNAEADALANKALDSLGH